MFIHRVAVLIASHNRRALTLASLESLFRQRRVEDLDVEVFLVDDGCTDGTGDAVRTRFPMVRVLAGNGKLYWNGGMRLAFDAATEKGFDAYIFFNDDTILYKDALERMVSIARERLTAGMPTIVVGSTRSPLTGAQSYGGFLKKARGPIFQLEMIAVHSSRAIPCDTMNGNFVLVPAEVATTIGNLERRFQHQFGDLDYGLRAKDAGFDLRVMPGYAGDCFDNPSMGTWRDPTISLARRWRHLMSPKGVPVAEWTFFTRRHFGWRWLHYAVSPYVKTFLSSALAYCARRRGKTALALERRTV